MSSLRVENQRVGALETVDGALADVLAVAAKGIAATRDALTFVTDPVALGDVLCELGGLATELDALKIRAAEQARVNGTPHTIGVRTVGQYVAARTNQSSAGTRTDLGYARWLRDFPGFAVALENREMTLQHVQYVRSKLDNPRSCIELRGAQQLLIDAARDCSFVDFKTVCDYWLIAVDPDGKEPQDQIESSFLRFRNGPGGRVFITGETDAITGQGLKAAVNHESRKLRDQDVAAEALRSDSQRASPPSLHWSARGSNVKMAASRHR